MDGRLKIETGTLADFFQFALLNTEALASGPVARGAPVAPPRSAPCRSASTPAALRSGSSRTTTTSKTSCSIVPRPGPPVPARTSPDPMKISTGASPQETENRRQASAPPRPPRARHRLRLGRARDPSLPAREGVEVDGVTLSRSQYAVSVSKLTRTGPDRPCEVRARRLSRGRTPGIDRIVSVGMLEHVGRHQLGTFFKKVAELLADDGVALIHAIGSFRDPGSTSTVDRGVHCSLAASCRLWTSCFERFSRPLCVSPTLRSCGSSHAETLRAWRQRFYANRERIRELYDERFRAVCGTSICTAPRWSSVPVRRWSSRSSSRVRPRPCPYTRDYIGQVDRATVTTVNADRYRGLCISVAARVRPIGHVARRWFECRPRRVVRLVAGAQRDERETSPGLCSRSWCFVGFFCARFLDGVDHGSTDTWFDEVQIDPRGVHCPRASPLSRTTSSVTGFRDYVGYTSGRRFSSLRPCFRGCCCARRCRRSRPVGSWSAAWSARSVSSGPTSTALGTGGRRTPSCGSCRAPTF